MAPWRKKPCPRADSTKLQSSVVLGHQQKLGYLHLILRISVAVPEARCSDVLVPWLP